MVLVHPADVSTPVVTPLRPGRHTSPPRSSLLTAPVVTPLRPGRRSSPPRSSLLSPRSPLLPVPVATPPRPDRNSSSPRSSLLSPRSSLLSVLVVTPLRPCRHSSPPRSSLLPVLVTPLHPGRHFVPTESIGKDGGLEVGPDLRTTRRRPVTDVPTRTRPDVRGLTGTRGRPLVCPRPLTGVWTKSPRPTHSALHRVVLPGPGFPPAPRA